MKDYKAGKGWLFPLVGGPWGKRKGREPIVPYARRDITAVALRLGVNRERTLVSALFALPPYVDLDGERYEQRPAFYVAGARKGERKTVKVKDLEVPMVHYVHVPAGES